MFFEIISHYDWVHVIFFLLFIWIPVFFKYLSNLYMFMYVKKGEKKQSSTFLKKVHSNCLITWTTKHDLVHKLTVTFTSSAAIQIGDGRTPRRRQAWYWVRFTSTSIWRLYQFLEKHLCWKVDLLMNWNNVNFFFIKIIFSKFWTSFFISECNKDYFPILCTFEQKRFQSII